MEREPGPPDEKISPDPVQSGNWFKHAVENNTPITLKAQQVDQIIASIGLCSASIFSIIEAMNSEDNQSFKRKMLYEAGKSIDEASILIEDLTSEFTK